MKKILIIALCLACTASFAQTKKKGKATTKPKTTKRVAGVQPPVDTVKKTLIVKDAPVETKPVVTAPAVPSKPFEAPLDGYYKENDVVNAHVTPYATLREADVVYKRWIWREIDVREKINQFMASPKSRLIDVLMDAVSAGELTAYDPNPNPAIGDPNGDSFKTPLTADKAKAKMADSTIVDHFDAKGDKTGSKLVAGEYNPDSVLRFRIKEQVIFDKQRSVEETRIIGIAPLVRTKVAGAGLAFDFQPAFWIYFPAARQILVTKQAVNSRNDAMSLSYDDVFLKRMFASYIVKQSNDKDDRIKDEYQGIDRLYESERIKKTLMDWELNLWQY